jgi:hypothetical protein
MKTSITKDRTGKTGFKWSTLLTFPINRVMFQNNIALKGKRLENVIFSAIFQMPLSAGDPLVIRWWF